MFSRWLKTDNNATVETNKETIRNEDDSSEDDNPIKPAVPKSKGVVFETSHYSSKWKAPIKNKSVLPGTQQSLVDAVHENLESASISWQTLRAKATTLLKQEIMPDVGSRNIDVLNRRDIRAKVVSKIESLLSDDDAFLAAKQDVKMALRRKMELLMANDTKLSKMSDSDRTMYFVKLILTARPEASKSFKWCMNVDLDERLASMAWSAILNDEFVRKDYSAFYETDRFQKMMDIVQDNMFHICHELVESKPPFMTLSATYEFLKLMEEAALYQFEKEIHPIDMLSNDTILKELSDLNSSQRLALSMYIPVILMLGHEGPVMEDHNEFLKHKTKVIEMGSCIVARLPIELTSDPDEYFGKIGPTLDRILYEYDQTLYVRLMKLLKGSTNLLCELSNYIMRDLFVGVCSPKLLIFIYNQLLFSSAEFCNDPDYPSLEEWCQGICAALIMSQKDVITSCQKSSEIQELLLEGLMTVSVDSFRISLLTKFIQPVQTRIMRRVRTRALRIAQKDELERIWRTTPLVAPEDDFIEQERLEDLKKYREWERRRAFKLRIRRESLIDRWRFRVRVMIKAMYFISEVKRIKDYKKYQRELRKNDRRMSTFMGKTDAAKASQLVMPLSNSKQDLLPPQPESTRRDATNAGSRRQGAMSGKTIAFDPEYLKIDANDTLNGVLRSIADEIVNVFNGSVYEEDKDMIAEAVNAEAEFYAQEQAVQIEVFGRTLVRQDLMDRPKGMRQEYYAALDEKRKPKVEPVEAAPEPPQAAEVAETPRVQIKTEQVPVTMNDLVRNIWQTINSVYTNPETDKLVEKISEECDVYAKRMKKTLKAEQTQWDALGPDETPETVAELLRRRRRDNVFGQMNE